MQRDSLNALMVSSAFYTTSVFQECLAVLKGCKANNAECPVLLTPVNPCDGMMLLCLSPCRRVYQGVLCVKPTRLSVEPMRHDVKPAMSRISFSSCACSCVLSSCQLSISTSSIDPSSTDQHSRTSSQVPVYKTSPPRSPSGPRYTIYQPRSPTRYRSFPCLLLLLLHPTLLRSNCRSLVSAV